MKISGKSNIYEVTAETVCEVYAPFVEVGERNLALCLSNKTLNAAARNAIEKSLESFGYGTNACTFAHLRCATNIPQSPDLGLSDLADPIDPTDSIDPTDFIALGGHDLLSLVEGTDPLCLVACDEESISALQAAYRTRITPDDQGKLLGRPYVAFRNFELLLETAQGKQTAWALLKQLPRP